MSDGKESSPPATPANGAAEPATTAPHNAEAQPPVAAATPASVVAPAAEPVVAPKPVDAAPAVAVMPAVEPAKAKRGWIPSFRRGAKETTVNRETIPVVVTVPKKKKFYQRRSFKLASKLIAVWVGWGLNTYTWNPALNAGAVSFQHAAEGHNQTFGQKFGSFVDSWVTGASHAYGCSVDNMNKKDPLYQYNFSAKPYVQDVLGAGSVVGNSVMGFFTSGAGTIAGSFRSLPVRPADAKVTGSANITSECG